VSRELHQIGHAHGVEAGLTQTMRGLFDNPASGLLPMALQVTHDQLSGILISPFFSEWTNFGKERPCRAVLLVEVPQFIGDRGWLDKELVGCFGQTLAHSRNIDH
jgi:hypothetical protein